jgi:pyrroline-5-carboxylate reductase
LPNYQELIKSACDSETGKTTMNQEIAFIGGGNMARSIIGGLVASGYDPNCIRAADPQSAQRAALTDNYGIRCFDNNHECIAGSNIIVFAVKPQIMKIAIQECKEEIARTNPLLVSIAAGIRIKEILRWCECDLPVIRVMPNTPALINAGVSGLYANSLASETQQQTAENILQAVGPAVWVNSESDIDVVTGISGSGPAYFFRLMEIMIAAAIDKGLDRETASTLVLNTALGAARLASESSLAPGELRRQVTSPGGTTEAALAVMESNGLEETVVRGIHAAIERSDELATQLGEE